MGFVCYKLGDIHLYFYLFLPINAILYELWWS